MSTKYRLLIDLPDGACIDDIYILQGDTYINERMIKSKSPVVEINSYFRWQVEDNQYFFERVEEQTMPELDNILSCFNTFKDSFDGFIKSIKQ